MWDYVLSFPVKVRDLSRDATLVFTAWTESGKPFGGTVMSLFDARGRLKFGKQKLVFFEERVGDPSSSSATRGENYDQYLPSDYPFHLEKMLEMYKTSFSTIEKSSMRLEWLDRLSLGKTERNLHHN